MEKYLFVFKNNRLFQGLGDDEILSLLHCINAVLMVKDKGEYIFRTGDNTSSMGLVLSGSVLSIQEDLWGHRNIMNKTQVGGFFAESFAVMPGTALTECVVANEKSEIMLLDMERIMTTCSKNCEYHNKLIRNAIYILAGKIIALNDKITHMSKRSTKEKLTSYLSSEARRQGKLSFDISYDRQQLADFLCVERAAMSAELSKLQREGLIKTNRNHFDLYTDINH